MMVLITDPDGTNHRAGDHHPESPARLTAVLRAADDPAVRDGITTVTPRAATDDELLRVHAPELLAMLERVRGRSAQLDPDTAVSPESVDIARRGAGSGLTALESLDRGDADAAFCVVRPPGHHATIERPMGFCLLNNIAVTAAALVARGERVLIADFDAHHGNGTQDIFWDEPNVLFVSWHQSPLYPGSGAITEVGGEAARGHTVNVPLVPDSTGDSYLETLDRVVGSIITGFAPTWLLVSAGFDAHRDDPLTDMGLTSGDYAELTTALMQAVPPGRTIAFLEGGYALGALQRSATATMGALLGLRLHPEDPTSGGAGSGRLDTLVDAIAHAQDLR
ncbi:MAG: histone deacetylase [Acidimicrobiales bacterium]